MEHLKKMALMNRLNLPNDLIEMIQTEYKYTVLSEKYKSNMDLVIDFIGYYEFLRTKLNRKFKSRDSLLKIVKIYDF